MLAGAVPQLRGGTRGLVGTLAVLRFFDSSALRTVGCNGLRLLGGLRLHGAASIELEAVLCGHVEQGSDPYLATCLDALPDLAHALAVVCLATCAVGIKEIEARIAQLGLQSHRYPDPFVIGQIGWNAGQCLPNLVLLRIGWRHCGSVGSVSY